MSSHKESWRVAVATLLFLTLLAIVTQAQSIESKADHQLSTDDQPLRQGVVQKGLHQPKVDAGRGLISSILMVESQIAGNRTLWETTKGAVSITTRQIPGAQDLYRKCAPGVVLLASLDGSSLGSGSVISSEGEIISNWHVVAGSDRMIVFFYDPEITNLKELSAEKYAIATVVATDTVRDLALLKLSSSESLTPLVLANDKSISIAQDVFSIGHPRSLIWSFTYGVVSQLRKGYEWSYDSNYNFTANVIQTQTPSNPGNSGGPLFNEQGEVIGINSFNVPEAEGLNFAVHISEIHSFVSQARGGEHSPAAKTVTQSVGSTELQWDEYDSNGDGIVDTYRTDINGDGKYDLATVDSDQDGVVDYYFADTNADGIADIYIYDRDGDSYFEYWVFDTDFDGEFDTDGIDTNKDGSLDKFLTHVIR